MELFLIGFFGTLALIGSGFFVGRVTSGAKELRAYCDKLLEAGEELLASHHRLAERNRIYAEADAKRRDTARRNGAEGLKAQAKMRAEAAAKQSALHETMRNERADVRELIA